MEIEKLRLANMDYLIASRFNGSQSNFAKAIGVHRAEISHFKKIDYPRSIGNSLARRIEATFGLENGWMDSLQQTNATIVEVPILLNGKLEGECTEIAFTHATPLIPIQLSILIQAGVSKENCVAIKINDGTMSPLLRQGDIAYIDTTKTVGVNGDTFAIDDRGSILIRHCNLKKGKTDRWRYSDSDNYGKENNTCPFILPVMGRVFYSTSFW